jgi:hypothetical protein
VSKGDRNRQATRDRVARMRAEEGRRRRRRLWIAGAVSAVVVAAAAVGITVAVVNNGNGGGPAAGALGPEGVPVPAARSLAGISASTTGQPIDGISCQTSEQTLFHIHAHLAIFVNGKPLQIPAAIGIPGAQTQNTARGRFIGSGTCFYWLHTHAADGIIHIESPVQRTYTLGNFFDVWGRKLSPNDVGAFNGSVTALYNGQVFRGNPRDIPLTKHAQIQLDVGYPLVAPVAISFPSGL